MVSIFEKYEFREEEKIGSGKSGDVFCGIRMSDGYRVAIKKLSKDHLNVHITNLIQNEVAMLCELNHPNIVHFLDMFDEPDAYYLCMEYIRGGELFRRITLKTCYSEREARDACSTILGSIKHCHDHNVVHRDLKPENLVMSSDDNDSDIKLIDFGFAARCTNLSLTGHLGTPMYMAPEIWNKELYGKPVDMWAFGVITFILLGGYQPFHGNHNEMIQHITSGSYSFHKAYWSEVSAEAKNFISSLLTVDVSRRLTVDQALQHPWVTNKYMYIYIYTVIGFHYF